MEATTTRYELTIENLTAVAPGDSFNFETICTVGGYSVPAQAKTLDADSYVTQFKKYFTLRCYNAVLKVKYDEDFTSEEKRAKVYQMIYWLTATSVVHEKVLKAIEGIDDFMKSLESTDVTRFNDTPQSPYPDKEEFTTTLTSSTHSEDGGTPLERIQEIKNLFDNEMEIWCDEFVNTFIIM